MTTLVCLFLVFIQICNQSILAEQLAKDNGDIFVKSEGDNANNGNQGIHLDEIMHLCNSSFSTPMDQIIQFNNTGELPNIVDKTAPCFIRCYYEKSGLIDNWKLNVEKIREYMWPATGDTIDVCQEEGKGEVNACLRTYAIAKCLMLRALVDARSSLH